MNKTMNLTLYQRQVAWNAINLAKTRLDDDPHLANFILRSLDATKEAQLTNLSWAMHQSGCSKSDVISLIEHLEKHLLRYDNDH